MERWILVIFVLALFGGMAVMGWRYAAPRLPPR